MDKLDIYQHARRLELEDLKLPKSGIPKNGVESILSFKADLLASGMGLARVVKYVQSLRVLHDLTPCAILEIDHKGVIEILAQIQLHYENEWTRHDYKLTLKKYLEFLDHKDLAGLIRLGKVRAQKLPEELLSTEEVQEILDAAGSLEDRTFPMVLWESGCRIGELLSLLRKRVQHDSLGAVLIVEGKTGMRRVRIIGAAPILDEWISGGAFKPEERVFPRSYVSYAKRLKRLALRARIQKRIYPHLFRHSRATYLASYLTESQLCAHFGWVMGSPMPRTYVHLAGLELDSALAKVPSILHAQLSTRETSLSRLPHV